jgi:ribose/xylose/arabinose/galactoside ABC-type transport system permease subunit
MYSTNYALLADVYIQKPPHQYPFREPPQSLPKGQTTVDDVNLHQVLANATRDLAGVPVAMVTTSMYVIGGVLAAVGGVLMTRLGAGVPTAGTSFELQAIAACVIGGASLSGARGSAIGAAGGALIIAVLNNGGNLLAINAFYLQIAIGALVLVAVGFDQMNTRKKARS